MISNILSKLSFLGVINLIIFTPFCYAEVTTTVITSQPPIVPITQTDTNRPINTPEPVSNSSTPNSTSSEIVNTQALLQLPIKMITPTNIQWVQAIRGFPSGLQMAVLAGDLSKSGPYTIRVGLPANFKIPVHTNSSDQYVTVLSGSINIGVGDKTDTTQGFLLPQDSFFVVPAGLRHYIWTATEGAMLQMNGLAPLTMEYIENPSNSASP
jgi:mannose-6-phosphate isomerase-like protein (cupin superfamily)